MDRPGPPGQDAGDDAEHPGERVDAAGPHLALERGDGRGVRPSRHLHALDPLPMGGELEVVVVQALVLDVVPARFGSDFLTELLELRVEVSPEGVHPGIEPLELAQDGLVLGWADGGAEGVGTGTEPGDLLGETHQLTLVLGALPVGPGGAFRLAAELGHVVAEGVDLAVEALETCIDLVGVHDISFPHKGQVANSRLSRIRLFPHGFRSSTRKAIIQLSRCYSNRDA